MSVDCYLGVVTKVQFRQTLCWISLSSGHSGHWQEYDLSGMCHGDCESAIGMSMFM